VNGVRLRVRQRPAHAAVHSRAGSVTSRTGGTNTNGRTNGTSEAAILISKMLLEVVGGLDLERGRCQVSLQTAEAELASARRVMAWDQDQLFRLDSTIQAATSEGGQTKEQSAVLAAHAQEHTARCEESTSDFHARLVDLRLDLSMAAQAMDASACLGAADLVRCARPGFQSPFYAFRNRGLREMTERLQSPAGRQALRHALSLVMGRGAARHRRSSRRLRGCSLVRNVDCASIERAVISMLGSVRDTEQEVRLALAERQRECRQVAEDYARQVGQLALRQRRLEEALVSASERRAAMQEEMRLKRGQVLQSSQSLRKLRGECAASIAAYENHACSLRQMRSELAAPGAGAVEVQDCEVAPWVPEACSATCGGGTQRLRRRVVRAAGPLGMPCPLLETTQACNTQPCPVDCVVSQWAEWSQCSAACGGGSKSRTRSVSVWPREGGEPCPEEESVSEGCAPSPCDADCSLGAWAAWSPCSRPCGGGLRHRSRGVESPAAGSGRCPQEESRLAYSRCNARACAAPASAGSPRCALRADLVLLLDGGGDDGQQGFEDSKDFAKALIGALDLGADEARVGVILAGGPARWEAFRRCESGSAEAFPSCNVRLVLPLSADRAAASQALEVLQWPAAPAYTAGALSLAANLLSQQGRQDAASLVLVLARGRPQSASRTAEEAGSLRRRARVLWLLLADGLKPAEAGRWASQPPRENVLLAPGPRPASARLAELLPAICPALA